MMGRCKPPRPSRSDPVSAGSARAALATMLAMTRDPLGLSMESLVRSYRVPRSTIERMLAAEKARRAGA